MIIKFIKTHPGAKEPTRATSGAAAFDLYAVRHDILAPGETALVPTGIKMHFPAGMVGLICPRSGLALNHGVTVLNGPGVIDHDYRGEIGVILCNHGQRYFEVKPGDRVAQLLFALDMPALFEEATELSDTERGDGGFGSTGR